MSAVRKSQGADQSGEQREVAAGRTERSGVEDITAHLPGTVLPVRAESQFP